MLPEQIMEKINILIPMLIIIGMLYALVKFFVDRHRPVKTVKAKVIAKNRIENFSRYSGTGKSYRYAVVFEATGKKLSFYVGEFSYGGYRIGETGTLKYRGSRIVDFH